MKSWKQIIELFVILFRAIVIYAPSINTLENIKQGDNETLSEYFKRFNVEAPKVTPSLSFIDPAT